MALWRRGGTRPPQYTPLLDDLSFKVLATESKSLFFGLHINIYLVSFDGPTPVFTAVLTHACDAKLRSKRKFTRTSDSTVFSYFQAEAVIPSDFPHSSAAAV